MRAIGYFRESAAGGDIAQQNRAFLDYCRRQGLDADRTFVDGASSNGHAEGFRQLLAFLRAGGGEYVVVVPSIEALGSTVTDAARRYFQLEGIGVRVAPIAGGEIDGELVTLWSAKDAGDGIGERVRAAMRRKAVKGEVLGRPPYGYRVGNRRRLELVPEEAVVVRYIFRLYLNEGIGIRLIARRLNQEGLKTRRGANWSMVSIRDILRNRVYLGTYSRFGVRVAGSHPSLVSPEDFRKVEDRLNSRRTSYKPRQASKFLLSGIASCGYCGNRLIGVSRKQSWQRRSGERVENTYRYYQCESRTNQSVCNYHTRRADALEDEVRRGIAEAIQSAAPAMLGPTEGASAEQDRDRLTARLRAIDKRISRYVESAAKGRLAREKMHQLSVAAANDRLAIEDALEAVEQRVSLPPGGNASAQRNEASRLCEQWDALPFGQRQQALRDVVSEIVVTDDAVALSLRP